jgi:hypothetical protein
MGPKNKMTGERIQRLMPVMGPKNVEEELNASTHANDWDPNHWG